jgi:hypothetical protein
MSNTMSLRESAMHDALLYHGPGAVADLKEKLRQRKFSKRKGIRTNIGNPSSMKNSKRKNK